MMNGDRFRKNLKLQLDDNPQLKGLEVFKRQLEKEYFAKVSVRNCSNRSSRKSVSGHSWNLVIDMSCNFKLVEVLHYLQNGSWGASAPSDTAAARSAFQRALIDFADQNTFPVDVEEFSLVLKDTSIVIKRIYAQSIVEQLGNILQALAAHYVHLTKDLTETPYEMYLPVFAEDVPNPDAPLSSVIRDTKSARDYFSYWALYFDSQEDAKIYDLDNKTIISGDLHMLNH